MALTRDRLELLIDHSTDIVCATDRKGMVVYYNDGASKSLGYTQDEILGEFVVKLYPSLEEAKRVMAAMRDAGHGGKGVVESIQTTFQSKEGEHIPVAVSGTLYYDDTGAEDGTIGFAKDLREILRKDQLATLGEVAVGLSHEINNPLAVILNQVELLEGEIGRLAGDDDTSVECERLDSVRREIARIAEILERLGKMVVTEHYETVEYIGPARMIDLRGPRNESSDPRLRGVRILVVDDDLGICRTLTEILEADGCVVESASDGAEGLRRAQAGGLDIVLTDVVMPNMDGYEFFHTIHQDQPDLPVLLMTAFHYDKDHIIKRGRLEGLQGVVFKKPVDSKRLREVIVETIESRRDK
ncbi:MAG: response regulator [Myxococcales bacterium]|nr:response regulator [Myxococcales bacterium]